MRLLTALAVALCLTVSGGAVTVHHADPATPILSAGKLKLADAVLVKPPLSKLQASFAPDPTSLAPTGASPLRRLSLDLPSLSVGDDASVDVLPAALLAFAAHPTRAGP